MYWKNGGRLKRSRTVLVVSHNLATIKSLCTRCVEIKNGSFGNTGVPSDVVRNYLHQHSAEYADTSGFISKDASLYNTGVIKFDRVQIIDDTHATTRMINYNTDFSIRINLVSTQRLDDLIFHVNFSTEDGIDLSYASNLYDDARVELEPGNNEINISLMNYLQPGTYFISLSASKTDGTTMDLIENIIKVTVVEGEIKKAVKWPDIYRGLTVMKSDWKTSI